MLTWLNVCKRCSNSPLWLYTLVRCQSFDCESSTDVPIPKTNCHLLIPLSQYPITWRISNMFLFDWLLITTSCCRGSDAAQSIAEDQHFRFWVIKRRPWSLSSIRRRIDLCPADTRLIGQRQSVTWSSDSRYITLHWSDGRLSDRHKSTSSNERNQFISECTACHRMHTTTSNQWILSEEEEVSYSETASGHTWRMQGQCTMLIGILTSVRESVSDAVSKVQRHWLMLQLSWAILAAAWFGWFQKLVNTKELLLDKWEDSNCLQKPV